MSEIKIIEVAEAEKVDSVTNEETDLTKEIEELDSDSEEVKKWKSFSRKNEAKLKDALKKENDLTSRITELETSISNLAGSSKELAKIKVLINKGLPLELADVLAGDNEEAWNIAADKLLTFTSKKEEKVEEVVVEKLKVINPLQNISSQKTLNLSPAELLIASNKAK